VDEQLRLAYLRTTYWAETPLGEIRLRIGVANPRLTELLIEFSVEEWAFITACNPSSKSVSDDENERLQQALKAVLRIDGFTVFNGAGTGDDGQWPPEPSFLVLGISTAKAIALGRVYGQNAIVAGIIGAVPYLIECIES